MKKRHPTMSIQDSYCRIRSLCIARQQVIPLIFVKRCGSFVSMGRLLIDHGRARAAIKGDRFTAESASPPLPVGY